MRKLAGFVFALFVVSMALSPTIIADEVYARIRGTVTDASGAVVHGAEVKATNTQTGFSKTIASDEDGSFQFLQLPVGMYDVVVAKSGFRKFTAQHIVLVLNQVYNMQATLEVGQIAETVTVEANPMQVESSVTQLQTVVDAQKIVDLPLISRDWTQLQQLVPGVVAGSDRFGTVSRGNAYASNGSQSQQNSVLIDGADSNDIAINAPIIIPSPDAIQEFNFVTNTINPEYGRNSGGVLNAVIKSGTNQFHGSAFEFFRDTSLNTPNFFRQPNVFHQNQYGGTLGGPVVKDRTFFFISYQGTRARQAQGIPNNILPTVFSQDQRNGFFPAIATSTASSPIPLVGESGATFAAGTPYSTLFPTGHIPLQDINPISQKLLSSVPLPNSPGNLYSYSPVTTQTIEQGIAKVDHRFGQNDALWASTFIEDNPQVRALSFGGSNLPGFGENDKVTSKSLTAAWSHTFSPTMLNELRASYVRTNFDSGEPIKPVLPSSLGFTGINTQNTAGAGVPFIGVTGYFNLGFGIDGPAPRIDEVYQLTDNLSKVIGKHTLKFGFTGERFAVSNPFAFENNGNYTFGGTGLYSTGDPGADFVLGIPDSYLQSGGGHQVERTYEYYFYAQDSWKIRKDLTLNYGLGYQIDTPLQNKYFGGKGFNCFRPGEQSTVFPTAPAGLVFPGDKGCTASGYNTHYDNFGPRFGFAYSPEAGWLSGGSAQKFVIRGGFGIYFNRTEEEVALQNLLAPPFGLVSGGIGDVGGNPSFANPFTDIASGQSIPNKFPFTPPLPGDKTVNFKFFEPMSINTTSPDFATPYVMNYNLNIQRELPGTMVMQIGYVGAQGRHLEVAYEGNPITLAGAAQCAADPACIASRTIQQILYPSHTLYAPGNVIASVGTQGTIGVSSYNSLQASLRKNFSHGLTFTAGYTWSHSIDDGSGYEESSTQSGSNGRDFNIYNARLSRGDSAFDARHRFVASYDYELPHLRRWNNAFVKYGLNGWRLSGITTLQTGFPFTPFDSGLRSLTCSALNYYGCSDGPNGVGAITTFDPRNSNLVNKVVNPANTTVRPNYWFDPNQFTRQAFGMFGTSGRNSIHGPGLNNTDLAVQKEIQFNEARKIQLRLEAYNLFNHAQFNLPGSNAASSSTFGRITSAHAGRLIQLGAKFYF
jgi:hypothetical protein